MRERIKEPLAEEVVEYIVKPRSLPFLARDYRHLMWINKAHALMLVRQDILSADVVRTLLGALVEMEGEGVEGFTFDPALEDLYLNMEHALIQRVGEDVGGRLHTGRSRNDLYATMTRMAVRDALALLTEPLFELRSVLLQRAEEQVETVMPGYTHLQPAQPTTLGHYLASVALALERDADRLLEVYPRLNLSPLGACAFAGTGFPIDREMTAALLGFDGKVESTLDSVASRDYVPEILAALAGAGVTLSRLAQDLYLWCSDEWATVEVADEVAITSSIMPQKKNPVTLEHIKAGAAHLIGALVSSLAVQKNVNFMHCLDMSHEAVTPLWDALAQAHGMMHLARRTVLGLQIRRELMARRAAEDFCTATELADFLVRENGLPFRVAHGIVANVVSDALQKGLRSNGISPDMVRQAASYITDKSVSLTADQIGQALDPVRNIESKRASGSPAPAETRKLVQRANERLERHRHVVRGWRDRQRKAVEELDQAVSGAT